MLHEQEKDTHEHLCKHHCLCHNIELFVIERMQIKSLLEKKKYSYILHHLSNILQGFRTQFLEGHIVCLGAGLQLNSEGPRPSRNRVLYS